MRTWSASLLAVAPLLFPACKSAPIQEPARLPFRVAVAIDSIHPQNPRSPDEDVRFAVDDRELGKSLAYSLQKCFERTIPLDPPPAPAQASGRETTREDRRPEWIRQAQGRDADLLLICGVEYTKKLETSTNEKLYLNLPLFLVGGPLNWFVNDRDYEPVARLDFSLIDLASVPSGSGAGAPSTSDSAGEELVSGTVKTERVTMDFLDRVGGNVGTYLISLVCPSGFLATDSDHVSRQLSEWTTGAISSGVASRLTDLRGAVQDPKSIQFYLGEGSEAVRRSSDPRNVQVSGKVFLRSGPLEDLVEECQIYAPGSPQQIGKVRLGNKVVDDTENLTSKVFRYDLAGDVAVDPGAHEIRLVIEDRGANPRRRSYTLPIREVKGAVTPTGPARASP